MFIEKYQSTLSFVTALNIHHQSITFQLYFMKFIADIGANLTDGMFAGVYSGQQKHPNDLTNVLERAWKNGMDKIVITVGTINEAPHAIELAEKDGESFIIDLFIVSI